MLNAKKMIETILSRENILVNRYKENRAWRIRPRRASSTKAQSAWENGNFTSESLRGEVSTVSVAARRSVPRSAHRGISQRCCGDRAQARAPHHDRNVQREKNHGNLHWNGLPVHSDRCRGTGQSRRSILYPRGQLRRPSAPGKTRRFARQRRFAAKRRNDRGLCARLGYPAVVPDLRDHAGAREIRARQIAAREGTFAVHTGISVSDDAFYAETPAWISQLNSLGILNVEMEASAFKACGRTFARACVPG